MNEQALDDHFEFFEFLGEVFDEKLEEDYIVDNIPMRHVDDGEEDDHE